MTAVPTMLDPFGLWPTTASAIAGLGGATPGLPHYAFHTLYILVEPGLATFEIAFDDLEATSGALRLLVSEAASDGSSVRNVRRRKIPLAQLAAGQRPVTIRFRARRGCAYAIVGEIAGRKALDGSEPLSAAGVRITLDRADTRRIYADRLAHARRSIYQRGPGVDGRWWRRSPVGTRGLVVDRRATLADPVSQMCTAAQFAEPEFRRWTEAIGKPQNLHRKTWEFAYVLRVLEKAGALRPGARGLGFGVGTEALPSLFASMEIAVTATDLPTGHENAIGWTATGQHSDGLAQLYMPELCSREAFDRNVVFRAVDMNDIPNTLEGFDFCWSACAFEHLGSIEAGLRFFQESVRCLKPGGIAVHTTELNLTSNDHTLSEGATVLFRRRDMETLALQLHREGHEVWPITYDQGEQPADRHVDVPPYLGDEHLKVALASYVTTSFGLVARKGARAG